MPDANPRMGPTYEALVEQALVGVYVVQDGRLVYANPRMAELFGYTTEALLALPSVLTLVDQSDRAAVEIARVDDVGG